MSAQKGIKGWRKRVRRGVGECAKADARGHNLWCGQRRARSCRLGHDIPAVPCLGGNPLRGAPRIHGELLKLGIDVGQTTVAKYMAKRRRPPSQGWRTFLRNHADGIASMDLFVVPTISFRFLYGLLMLQHGPRQILWGSASATLTGGV
jgi:hypothetical protein